MKAKGPVSSTEAEATRRGLIGGAEAAGEGAAKAGAAKA